MQLHRHIEQFHSKGAELIAIGNGSPSFIEPSAGSAAANVAMVTHARYTRARGAIAGAPDGAVAAAAAPGDAWVLTAAAALRVRWLPTTAALPIPRSHRQVPPAAR